MKGEIRVLAICFLATYLVLIVMSQIHVFSTTECWPPGCWDEVLSECMMECEDRTCCDHDIEWSTCMGENWCHSCWKYYCCDWGWNITYCMEFLHEC
jgi:hypothetical protein